ncbi:MAG: hypothetical protein ACK5YR_19385 [Pirellula sp.]|jgi:hypothetical protein
MLKSSSKSVFHCTVCGHVAYEDDSVNTPNCCGQSMYLACKAQKQTKANRNSREQSERRATRVHENAETNPPTP